MAKVLDRDHVTTTRTIRLPLFLLEGILEVADNEGKKPNKIFVDAVEFFLKNRNAA